MRGKRKSAKISALLGLLLLPALGQAEGPADSQAQLDLNLSNYPVMNPVKPGEPLPGKETDPVGEEEEANDEERRKNYAAFPDKNPGPTRFSLEDRGKFRTWIQGLCQQEAVAEDETARVRFAASRSSVIRPKNKQGSLRLLLENYLEDVDYQSKCAVKKKHNNNACLGPDRAFGKSSFVSLANWKFHSKSAANSDLAELTSTAAKSRQKVFRLEFWELREAAELNGKPASAVQARRILSALNEDSTCRTRAVETSRWSPRVAQK